jgi:hypothetical protein
MGAPVVTAAERLTEAEERLEDLEGQRDRLLGIVESLVAALEQLAVMAGASPAAAKAPARAALTVIQGGAS